MQLLRRWQSVGMKKLLFATILKYKDGCLGSSLKSFANKAASNIRKRDVFFRY
jgi:hypothetical protein